MGTHSQRPIVSVVLPARDAGAYLGPALRSVLRQTLSELELIVVDDGSTDGTQALLAGIDDPRLVVVSHDEPHGLAAALNAGIERATGAYIARMDADDVALPRRLERQVACLRAARGTAVVGTGVVELSATGRLGRVHLVPGGAEVTRWRALFGTPFFHPSVMLDRAILERHGLSYDPEFAVTQDYELWGRILDVADGDNIPEPLVLYRAHAGQASAVRSELQTDLRRRIALERIRDAAAGLDEDAAELAWLAGDVRPVPPGRELDAVHALLELLAATRARREVRRVAARALARLAIRAGGADAGRVAVEALRLDPLLPLTVARLRSRERRVSRAVKGEARTWLRSLERGELDAPVRVTVVSPEPAPYRAPLFDRIAERPEVELHVVYAGWTIADRTWTVELDHPHTVLRGLRVPGARALLHHDYPISPGVVGALRRSAPDVVVVSGWSTFACQAAIAWCRATRTPYVLQVESHDAGPRAGWRRLVKGAIVPRVVRGAAAVLVTGTLVRDSMVERGADPSALGTFAVTVDVADYGERAEALAADRPALRAALGIVPGDVAVLSVARLAAEKGLDTLVRAAAAAKVPELVVVVVGEGEERERLTRLARDLGVRLVLAGALPWERVVEAYVAADVFALVSTYEPWGVVVNEAAACGKPLVLSDRVGAAPDLLREGENGYLVAAGDADALAAALSRLAADADLRLAAGVRSRELVAPWGYDESVEAFVSAVACATGPDPFISR